MQDDVESEDTEGPVREVDEPLGSVRVDDAAVDEDKPEEDGNDDAIDDIAEGCATSLQQRVLLLHYAQQTP